MTGRSDFADRRAARVERLEQKATKLQAEGETKLGAADAIADRIPMGQPILVGHHSERRARRDQERIQAATAKGVELLNAAKEAKRQAEAAIKNAAIDSDDPDALRLLREKAAKLEAEQAKLATFRKVLRGPNAEMKLLALGVPQLTADELVRCGIPDFVGANLSGRIRSTKKRIAELEKAAARETPADETYGEIVISESLNRVQVRFPGKPDEPTRDLLKSRGFRWAPSEKAWQRKASTQAWHAAREIAAESAR